MDYSYRFMRFPGGKPKAVTFSYDDATKFDKPFCRDTRQIRNEMHV